MLDALYRLSHLILRRSDEVVKIISLVLHLRKLSPRVSQPKQGSEPGSKWHKQV